MLKNSLRNIFRKKGGSIIILAVSAALTALLMIYMQNMLINRQKLDELYENIEVTCIITNYSGEVPESLEIPENTIKAIEKSGFVKESCYTMKAGYAIMTDKIWITNDVAYGLPRIIGTNNISATAAFERGALELIEGIDENVFSGNDKLCVVSEDFLKEYGLKLGDVLDMDIYTEIYHNMKDPSDREQRDGNASLSIAGVYRNNYKKEPIGDIYCPYNTLRDSINDGGKGLYASSAEFLVCNTKHLDKFKQLLFSRVESKTWNLGYVLFDSTLASAVSPLEDTMSIMNGIFPFLYIAIAFISFAVSYMIMHNRKRDMALTMSIGQCKAYILVGNVLENLVLCIFGSILGITAFALYFGVSMLQQLAEIDAFVYIAIYIATYTAGAVLCSTLFLRLSPIQMLSRCE